MSLASSDFDSVCILTARIEGVVFVHVERVAVLLCKQWPNKLFNVHALNPFLVLISAQQATKIGRRLERSIGGNVTNTLIRWHRVLNV